MDLTLSNNFLDSKDKSFEVSAIWYGQLDGMVDTLNIFPVKQLQKLCGTVSFWDEIYQQC